MNPQDGSNLSFNTSNECFTFQAFPCISTGVYGYQNSNACDMALRTTREFMEENHEVSRLLWARRKTNSLFQNVDRVIFCLFMKVDVELYTQRMPIMFPSKDWNSKKKYKISLNLCKYNYDIKHPFFFPFYSITNNIIALSL